MYQLYDELSMRILGETIDAGKDKPSISTTRTSIQKFREFMEGNELSYSPEIAASWLEEKVRPTSSHEVYKRVRFVHYRIATLFNPMENLRELFYKNIQSDYDRLPSWAQEIVSGFLAYYKVKQKCINHFKAAASTFLLHQIREGLDSISSLSYRRCADYYQKHGPIIGVGRFLAYLGNYEMVAPYVEDSYHFLFSKRISNIPLDAPLRMNGTGCSIQEYKTAQTKAYETLKSQGYSKTIRNSFLSLSNEFGVFLGYNGLRYSEETATFFIEHFRRSVSPNIDAVRRSLLIIGYLLNHAMEGDIPLAFPKKQSRAFPAWAEPEVAAYRAIRERAGKTRSTLDMDRSSLARFLTYLDCDGCRGFEDLSVEKIKGFSVQDSHSTNEGKNAYNVRIRGFLRFLEGRELLPKGVSKALPSVNGVKARPAVILSRDDQRCINEYCEQAEKTGGFLESAVLKIATQTGLRGIDIARLRCDSIDWNNREFTLIQQKTRKHIRLPFSNGVGNAILKYVEEDRPTQKVPYLFISPRAPHGCLSKEQVNRIVSKALKRKTGSHILRKTFASNLLNAGVGYDTVSDVLGHESSETVDTYLSTANEKMRQCALPLGNTSQYTGGLL
ncbi:MAG: hypothetical protein EOM45_08510 [Clostridia bacterium]|nr:hypothetical protein [Clostridia bacterium]